MKQDEQSASAFNHRQEAYWHDATHRKRKDPRHPVIAAYVQPKISFIEQHIQLGSAPRILDVGAGNGYFSYWWNQRGEVTATDYSDVMLEGNPVPKREVMDARHLSYADNMFDLSFCHAVFHHIEKSNRLQVLREMARVSTRYVAYIEPNIWNPIIAGFSALKKEEHGALCFTHGYVRGLAKEAGLHVLWSGSWGLLTPNRMPLSSVLIPFFSLFERPMPLGVTNIVIAEKVSV